MTRTQLYARLAYLIPVAALTVLLWGPLSVQAQDRDSRGNLLDNLFSRGERSEPPSDVPGAAQNQPAQADSADLAVRLDRMENALRQLTGTIEQLQYRNQQLEMQLKRMQDEAGYRPPPLGAKDGGGTASAPMNARPMPPTAATRGERSDTFDPAQHPNAPGAPRVLGHQPLSLPPQNSENRPPAGQPGGRSPGAPIDLSNANEGTQLATLPPSARPQDEYDLAYGYVLHKDYALAEQAFRDFLLRYPDERFVPDAQYWLGEVLFQQQRYREAAESFLAVSTKYDHAGKAPDSLLRLGQSLAALQKKEAACATFAEINRKYPSASASVKHGAAQELKRAHC